VQGNADAQNNLGFMCENGEGMQADYKEAAKWYRLGAERGSARAQFHSAEAYELGRGIGQDRAAATKRYGVASGNGDKDAIAALSRIGAPQRPHEPPPPNVWWRQNPAFSAYFQRSRLFCH
jgi:TPR repeat protein